MTSRVCLIREYAVMDRRTKEERTLRENLFSLRSRSRRNFTEGAVMPVEASVFTKLIKQKRDDSQGLYNKVIGLRDYFQ